MSDVVGRAKFAVFFASLLLVSPGAFAGAAITYHGRLLDSGDQPVQTPSVVFKIQIRSPGTQDCLLFEEARTLDMRNSDGVFVIPIGDGQGHRSGGDPGITVEDVFSNDGVARTGLSCNSGHDYQPQALDSRKLVVTFNDGSGSGEQVLPPMDVNFVPFAIHATEASKALKIGSTPAAQVMSVSAGSATPLTAGNFTELLALVNGTSATYLKASSLPSCASSEVLKASGGAFVCVSDAMGTDTLAGITCADGKILKRMAGVWACADESGVGTESDPTVQAFAKSAPGAGLKIASGAIAADFGAVAGKVVEGNDARLSDSRAPNGAATGDLSGSFPNPSVKAIRGNTVNASAPADGQVYKWVTGASEFQPKYVGITDLRKSDGSAQMPATCAANETLSWSSLSDSLTCVAIGSLDASKITSGTLSVARLPAETVVLSCADGKIAKRVAGAWSCADESVGAETDPSVQAYAKVAPGAGLKVTSGAIVPDFGSTAGKVVEGNDSRLSDTRVASDINGVVATGIIQRTGTGAFAALGTSAPVSISGGNIGLAVGGGLTLSSGLLVPDFGTVSGKVAQGNDSRFPSSTCASGSYSRWTGAAWTCDADVSTDLSKVAKAGDTMTGTLNLPTNGLVLGTTQLVASGGRVGIGTASPSASAILDLNSTSAGFLPPRMTTAQRNAITSPATGLTIFNSTTNAINVYDGSAWVAVALAGGSSQWTTSGSDISYSTGNVGIGTSGAPAAKLEVAGGVKIGNDSATCDSSKSGTFRWTGTQLSFCQGNSWKPIKLGFSATGGTITDVGGYRIHTFTSSGTFTADATGDVEVLVVAGGGGGGGRSGGGGGGGGVIYNASYAVSTTPISVTVGGGGAGGDGAGNIAAGGSGQNSVFGTLTAIGGGAGADDYHNSGYDGGNGGGGKYGNAGGNGTSGQGFAGGSGYNNPYAGGGGGGAGGVGVNGTSGGEVGDGGPGYASSISGSLAYYGGGGGGGAHNPANGLGYGGSGGGGNGGAPGGKNSGSAGTANTGGGGGGGSTDSGNGGAGGAGGSGIVIVRYVK